MVNILIYIYIKKYCQSYKRKVMKKYCYNKIGTLAGVIDSAGPGFR